MRTNHRHDPYERKLQTKAGAPSLQRRPASCLARVQTTSTEGAHARIRRVTGFATSTGFAGHAGDTASIKLTFHPDHLMKAGQS